MPEEKIDSPVNETILSASEHDRLKFEAAAESLAVLINDEKSVTPLVVGVDVLWGTGKSTLVNRVIRKTTRRGKGEAWRYWLASHGLLKPVRSTLMSPFDRVRSAIEKARPYNPRYRHTICHFNAWMHDDAPQIMGVFAEEVIKSADSARSLFNQVFRPVRFKWGWVLLLQTLVFIFVMLLIKEIYNYMDAMGNIPESFSQLVKTTSDQIRTWIATGLSAGLALLILGFKQIQAFLSPVTQFLRDPARSAARARVVVVRRKIGHLVEQATTRNRKLVILVDDLDRCKPENSLAILECANQILGHKNVIVVVAGDLQLTAAAAGLRFKSQAEILTALGTPANALSMNYGWMAIRRLVQMNIQVPPPNPKLFKPGMEELEEAEEHESGSSPKIKPLNELDEATVREVNRCVGYALRFLAGLGLVNPREEKRTEDALRVHLAILARMRIPLSRRVAEMAAKWMYLQDVAPRLTIWLQQEGVEAVMRLEELERESLEVRLKQDFGVVHELRHVVTLLLTSPKLHKGFEAVAYWEKQ